MAERKAYVELGVTLGGLVEASLLEMGGHEAARGSTDEGLASQSPACSHSSDRRHGGSGSYVDVKVRAKNEVVGENHEHPLMLADHVKC